MNYWETKYGSFSIEQIEDYKTILHKRIFWLLLYKDPNTSWKYENVDFKLCFHTLMKQLDGFNELIGRPSIMVELMSVLEASYKETVKESFCYSDFRRLILQAESLVDKISIETNKL